MQDPTTGPFPSHHHHPRPPLHQSPAAQDASHPPQVTYPGMKHPPRRPALPGEPRGRASPPSCGRHALAPRYHLSSIKQHGSVLLSGPVARLALPSPPRVLRHSDGAAAGSLLGDFSPDLGEELGHCRAARAVLDPVHLELSGGRWGVRGEGSPLCLSPAPQHRQPPAASTAGLGSACQRLPRAGGLWGANPRAS